MCGFLSVLAPLHPPSDNPIRVSNCAKYHHEIKTDGTDITDGWKVDDIEKLEELNNLKINVFELTEGKVLTQLYVSTC